MGKSITEAIVKLVNKVQFTTFENKVFAQAPLFDMSKIFICKNHQNKKKNLLCSPEKPVEIIQMIQPR